MRWVSLRRGAERKETRAQVLAAPSLLITRHHSPSLLITPESLPATPHHSPSLLITRHHSPPPRITPRHSESHVITPRHSSSPRVTPRHSSSPRITPRPSPSPRVTLTTPRHPELMENRNPDQSLYHVSRITYRVSRIMGHLIQTTKGLTLKIGFGGVLPCIMYQPDT
jgi:hypothetical protein